MTKICGSDDIVQKADDFLRNNNDIVQEADDFLLIKLGRPWSKGCHVHHGAVSSVILSPPKGEWLKL